MPALTLRSVRRFCAIKLISLFIVLGIHSFVIVCTAVVETIEVIQPDAVLIISRELVRLWLPRAGAHISSPGMTAAVTLLFLVIVYCIPGVVNPEHLRINMFVAAPWPLVQESESSPRFVQAHDSAPWALHPQWRTPDNCDSDAFMRLVVKDLFGDLFAHLLPSLIFARVREQDIFLIEAPTDEVSNPHPVVFQKRTCCNTNVVLSVTDVFGVSLA
jgi:hypothetical protein